MISNQKLWSVLKRLYHQLSSQMIPCFSFFYLKKLITKKPSQKEIIHGLKQVIASVPSNIFWEDKEGRLLGCNDNMAKIFKLHSPKEIIGKMKKDLMGEDFYALVKPMDNIVFGDKKEITVEETGFDEQGNIAIYLTKKKPLFDSKGEVIGLIGTSMDITERKNMEKELLISKEKAEAASQAKSEFLENMWLSNA